jgi:LAO/AO transport system kinase
MDLNNLLQRFQEGDILALSRIITLIENSNGSIPPELKPLFSKTGRAFRIGITGPPGAGKSTLVDGIAMLCRSDDRSVGIIAVDPTSPFSGGALLGDRVRMGKAGLDPGIYIRSMATRGNLGGLAEAALDAADILDSFGKDVIILETVGVGQSELDIARAADSTVVVLVPESGDGVQAMKAGLMEIGDIFVLNKADRPAAERAAEELKSALDLKKNPTDWKPPVLMTTAVKGEGIPELLQTLKTHWRTLAESGGLQGKRQIRRKERIRQIVERELGQKFWTPERLNQLELLTESTENPFMAASQLLEGFHC